MVRDQLRNDFKTSKRKNNKILQWAALKTVHSTLELITHIRFIYRNTQMPPTGLETKFWPELPYFVHMHMSIHISYMRVVSKSYELALQGAGPSTFNYIFHKKMLKFNFSANRNEERPNKILLFSGNLKEFTIFTCHSWAGFLWPLHTWVNVGSQSWFRGHSWYLNMQRTSYKSSFKLCCKQLQKNGSYKTI